MNKILLNKAIKDNIIYKIDNNDKTFSEPYYNSINGRIKFLEVKKINLSNFKLKGNYPSELLQNPIICLRMEYMNLNHSENSIDIFENNCNLVDIDGYSFKVYSTKAFHFTCCEEEIYKIFDLPNNSYYGQTDFIPKIKQNMELFFVVPDEETDYYFEIINGKIEEI